MARDQQLGLGVRVHGNRQWASAQKAGVTRQTMLDLRHVIPREMVNDPDVRDTWGDPEAPRPRRLSGMVTRRPVCDADTTSFRQTGKSLISQQPGVNPTIVLVHGAFA
jgi:hypothetical protein